MNQTTPMAMKIVFHCVVMVSGMITFVTKLSTSSVKDMFLVNLVFNEVFVAAGYITRIITYGKKAVVEKKENF